MAGVTEGLVLIGLRVTDPDGTVRDITVEGRIAPGSIEVGNKPEDYALGQVELTGLGFPTDS